MFIEVQLFIGVSISSFATIIGALVETTSTRLKLVFYISHGIVKKLLKIMR